LRSASPNSINKQLTGTGPQLRLGQRALKKTVAAVRDSARHEADAPVAFQRLQRVLVER
jgi:hypothetical protein